MLVILTALILYHEDLRDALLKTTCNTVLRDIISKMSKTQHRTSLVYDTTIQQ